MRLLHTSDWHLGRAFHRVNMLGAQAEFIGHLVTTVRERGVDAVVVSGDVYDRAVPPSPRSSCTTTCCTASPTWACRR